MVRDLFLGLILLFVIVLGGCALYPPPLPGVSEVERGWLAGLKEGGWRLNGRIGVMGGQENWHGGIRWEYRNGIDDLIISGPWGQGGVAIRVQPNWIRIERQDGRVQESPEPKGLLQEMLGVPVPLDRLHYWVLGLPAPGPVRYENDPQGRLMSLTQEGWHIEYHRYLAIRHGALPGKLTITGPDGVRLKLIVDRWEIRNGLGNA